MNAESPRSNTGEQEIQSEKQNNEKHEGMGIPELSGEILSGPINNPDDTYHRGNCPCTQFLA